MNKSDQQEKVALVTGAARRVGAAIATKLHHAGMKIILHYHHSESDALALCDQLNQQRANSAIAIVADLGACAQVETLMSKAEKQWQRLDYVVNNASSYFPTPLGKVTEQQFEDLIASNFKGPFFLMQAAIPALQRHHGAMVNIVDIHATKPTRNYSVYCAAKAALLSLTKAFANELAPQIRVNAVAPGAILWPEGVNRLSEQQQQQILNQVPLHRIGSPDDIADTVLFLLEQQYITGQVVAVDGGRSINYMDLN